MKYTIDVMLEMNSCDNIKCYECPFQLKEYNKKYDAWCKSRIYCRKHNIDYDINDNYYVNASKSYIDYLRERKLLFQDIMNL